MPHDPILDAPQAFLARKKKHHIPVFPVTARTFNSWLKNQSPAIRAQITRAGYIPTPEKTVILYGAEGQITGVIAGISTPTALYDLAHTVESLAKALPASLIESTSFGLENTGGLSPEDLVTAHAGWGLAHYAFSAYTSRPAPKPALVMAKTVDQHAVITLLDAVCMVRNLINMPSNDMGPDELEQSARAVAKTHKAKITVLHDTALLDQNFPLVYTVGQASPRRPRLIDLRWGSPKHPKITLVGKGVCFDTGGLDIKPSSAMRTMKKDMGGAAHALGLAHLIMAHHLPIQLRVLIPAVENAVGGASFRPGDIIRSRKGLTVENTNTDAEGRLILADALAYACEDSPELLIDFATLTGSARAALGPDIPALFSNDDRLARDLQKTAFACSDPVWHMPLWRPYRKYLDNSISDLINSAGTPGDLIYSALFLEHFVEPSVPWVHLDIYAWELSGRAGRPAGGCDTGLRAVYSYLSGRYAKV